MNILCTTDSCPVILGTNCIFYRGSDLPNTGIVTNDSVQTALQKIEAALSSPSVSLEWGNITGNILSQTDLITYITNQLTGYVPTSRQLTINGVTYDLSQDRTWNIAASGGETINSFLLMGA